jgi:hypothetical protein
VDSVTSDSVAVKGTTPLFFKSYLIFYYDIEKNHQIQKTHKYKFFYNLVASNRMTVMPEKTAELEL